MFLHHPAGSVGAVPAPSAPCRLIGGTDRASDGRWVTRRHFLLLPSGRELSKVIGYTVGWLAQENYIRSTGFSPFERVTLTQKGLAALNAVPQGLTATVGSSLVKATSDAERNWSGIGDLVGGVLGGLANSISGG